MMTSLILLEIILLLDTVRLLTRDTKERNIDSNNNNSINNNNNNISNNINNNINNNNKKKKKKNIEKLKVPDPS